MYRVRQLLAVCEAVSRWSHTVTVNNHWWRAGEVRIRSNDCRLTESHRTHRMPSYKLIYFDAKVRGETARMLFELAGQPYEDVRISDDDWPKYKPKTPFGFLPLLEVDGVVIAQSLALSRYLAHTFGFAGKNPLEAARADMIAETMEDVVKPLDLLLACEDEGRKAEITKKCVEESFPTMLANLEKVFCMNNDGSGFFVGDGVTWADLCFVNLINWFPVMGIEVPWDKAPKLKALKERVETIPKIADWIKRRPVTEY